MRAGPRFATLLLCTIVAASQAKAQEPPAAPAEGAYSETSEAAEPAPAVEGAYSETAEATEPAPAVEGAVPEAPAAEAAYYDDEADWVVNTGSRESGGLLSVGLLVLAIAAFFLAAGLVRLGIRRMTPSRPAAGAPAGSTSSIGTPAVAPPTALKIAPHSPIVDAATGPSTKSYFVSHATENSAEAKQLVAALESKGITCWIAPRNIKAGQAYGDAIGAAVARLTKATIVLVSAAAEKSDGVKAELELARRFQKPIVPVIINNHPPDKGMLYYIGTSHWVPFDGASAETITALADAVSD